MNLRHSRYAVRHRSRHAVRHHKEADSRIAQRHRDKTEPRRDRADSRVAQRRRDKMEHRKDKTDSRRAVQHHRDKTDHSHHAAQHHRDRVDSRRDREGQMRRIIVRRRMYRSREGRRQKVCLQMMMTIWILLILIDFYFRVKKRVPVRTLFCTRAYKKFSHIVYIG